MAVTVTTKNASATRTASGLSISDALPRNGGKSGGGRNGGGGSSDGGGSGGQGGRRENFAAERYRIGVMAGIASILMMFLALVSAYIIRAGLPGSTDWKPIPLPVFAWVSTVLIVLSSVTIAFARRAQAKQLEKAYRSWLLVTLALGLCFIGSQLLTWRQFVAQGVYMSSNPHSSFFYVLTGLHGLHLLGGILALTYLIAFTGREQKKSFASVEGRRRSLTEVVGLYWHFMDGLWVFLFLLLFLWR